MKIPFYTLAIGLIMVGLFLFFGDAPEQFTFYSGVSFKQPWRLITAHFVHSDAQHLIWNLSAFILLGSIIEQYSKTVLIASLGIGIVAINTYLLTLYQLNAYVGLSGVLNTLLVVALFYLCQHELYRCAAIWTLILSMIKIIVESFYGASLFTSISWLPVPEAHLFGWVAGVLMVIKQTLIYFNSNKYTRYKHLVNA